MKIGITGASGFIGSFVLKSLSTEGYIVSSLDKYLKTGAADSGKLEDCPDDFDWVLHFGADTFIWRSFSDPFSTYGNNVDSTLKALKIAHNSKAAFLFMSSYVYGKPEYLPVDEKHPVTALNPYMGSKIIGEQICLQFQNIFGIPIVIFRGFNIYGDYRKPGRLISDMFNAVRNKSSFILNDPSPKRDYLYINDFAQLILNLISTKQVKTGIYNVGNGESHSNLEVTGIVSDLLNGECSIVVESNPRRNDVSECKADISLVKDTFRWYPKYTLEEGLEDLVLKTI